MTIASQNLNSSYGATLTLDDALRGGMYGGRVYDGLLHRCRCCDGRIAFAYSVRIRQDTRSSPLCFDCRGDDPVEHSVSPIAA